MNKNQETVHGECKIPLVNYSNEEVQFNLTFLEDPHFESEIKSVSLMNKTTPYSMSLLPNEIKTVNIEKEINVAEMEEYFESGDSYQVRIQIRQGERSREL